MSISVVDISVVIVNYNQADLLCGILECLNHQKTTSKFEVIISDDGSNTENVTKIFDIINSFPNLMIRYVFQQDLGYRIARARNNAIRLAQGKIILTLDGDIFPCENFIEAHFKLHQEEENILVYADRAFKDIRELGNNLNCVQDILMPSNNKGNEILARKEKDLKENSPQPWQRVFGFNMSFPNRAEYLFDENFEGWGLEDIEFAYRLNKCYNCKIVHSSAKMFHINRSYEKPLNPYLSKNKRQLKDFFRNVLHFVECYGKDLEIIKLLYVPNINTQEKKGAAEGAVNFYHYYLKDVPDRELYAKALSCVEKIINDL